MNLNSIKSWLKNKTDEIKHQKNHQERIQIHYNNILDLLVVNLGTGV